MLTLVELRLVVVLACMFTLPGWALLSYKDVWRQWQGVQRWVIAIGVSIAFYPVLFYILRFALPFLTLGPYKMGTLLLLLAAVIAWQMRSHWREVLTFDRLEWVAIAVVGMTLFTRFWIIRDRPYPAWSDSLHHTLLTQLTAVQGQLPTSLEPYFPIPLEQYHLGLYALSTTVAWLAQVPAHTALLWMAQALNGLCGLGVYLVLDRKVGRTGAIVGAAVVGLLSHQPAFYVNWGRFTQLSSQIIMLIAWLVTWDALALWRRAWTGYKARFLWVILLAALLNGAVFFFHFRVAAFYLPLLVVSVAWEIGQAYRRGQMGRALRLSVAVGVVSLVMVAPVLWGAAGIHIARTTQASDRGQVIFTAEQVAETRQLFYEFPWDTIPQLAARSWLLILAGVSAVVGLIARNKLSLASLGWAAVLFLLGNTYRLGIPVLNLTNLGAVLIMLYLPIGLLVGSAVEESLAKVPGTWRGRAVRMVAALTLMAGFVASHVRVVDIEPFRYFVTAEDVAAMDWIRENTPAYALFAVNTFFWLPGAPHGTDAGYWIPYFTGRHTTVSAMLFSLGTQDYRSRIVEMSRAVEQLKNDPISLSRLRGFGVDYVYAGRMGDFSGPGLQAVKLGQSPELSLLYQNAGVSIFGINPTE